MVDKHLIQEKLKSIAQYLAESEPVLDLALHEFEKDIKSMRLAERDFQLIVDAAVDILNHVLLESGKVPPESYYDAFLEAGKEGILPRKLSKSIAASAGLRNRLVHEYEKINVQKLYRALKYFLPLFRTFCRSIYKRML